MNNTQNRLALPFGHSTQDFSILIVTGFSGAGKTSAMRSLEDLGFYCVDNLPIPLMFTFLNLIVQTQTNVRKVALGVDVRSQQYLQGFINEVARLKQHPHFQTIKVLFLRACEQTLLKRFQETRRAHPLAHGELDLHSAIAQEAKILAPILGIADTIIDTDVFNVHELRHWIRASFANPEKQAVLVNLVSFGFKFGVPAESNLVFDLRFLPNPYFVPELKLLTGKDTAIEQFLFSQEEINEYWSRLSSFLSFTLEKYYEEGRFYVTVAIGCTGGKHRSVAFVERLAKQEIPAIKFLLHHRDIARE